MSLATTAFVLLLALAIDAGFGYPAALFRAIGHPVTWMGRAISRLDRQYNKPDVSFDARKQAGVSAIALLTAGVGLFAFLLERYLTASWFGYVLLAAVTSTLIASRSLYEHVSDVARGLDGGKTVDARKAVSRIVGRDPEQLDEHAIARAAVESLAENASDGIAAPVLWFLVLGLPGAAAYKAINTADSMIGHRTPKYEAFGWAAAKLDDLVNWPASRLTGLLFAVAALLVPGASPQQAITAMFRDAKNHRSPNAGWPESAMAGALAFKLAGPRTYNGVMVDDAYMGDGNADLTAADIRQALHFALCAWAIMAGAIVLLWIIALV